MGKAAALGDLVIGIDVGTGGVRALAVTSDGEVVAAAGHAIERRSGALPDEWHEQDPESWWVAAVASLRAVAGQLGRRAEAVAALAVDGTSGTLICLDPQGRAVRPAIMYNDPRSLREAEELSQVAGEHCRRHGYRIAASFAAARVIWLLRHEPETIARTRWFGHQSDYINGRLTGHCGISDYSNALKTGFDLHDERWPEWWNGYGGVLERLPEIVAPGTAIGELSQSAAEELGLLMGTPVVSGATDGTAGFLASGARKPGDDNTTLGTTLVFKRVVERPTSDPQELIYAHKLPGELWLPGAASNTGAEWIGVLFGAEDPGALDRRASRFLPSDHLAYPLVRTGERFPFAAPQAKGFCEPEPADELHRYAANLQGVALTERLAYDVLDTATAVAGGDIYATGGGANSAEWLQVRADVTGRAIHRPECPESAFGSAVLAASAVLYDDLWAAAAAMVRVERSFAPDEGRRAVYDERYWAFRKLLAQRGYLPE